MCPIHYKHRRLVGHTHLGTVSSVRHASGVTLAGDARLSIAAQPLQRPVQAKAAGVTLPSSGVVLAIDANPAPSQIVAVGKWVDRRVVEAAVCMVVAVAGFAGEAIAGGAIAPRLVIVER